MRETRMYPVSCTSAFCGRSDCTGCPTLPVLARFKAWRERTAAVREDPIWSPSFWTATVPDPTPNVDADGGDR